MTEYTITKSITNMLHSFTKEDLYRRIKWYIKLRFFYISALGLTGIIPQLIQVGFVSQVVQNIGIVLAVFAVNGLFLLAGSFRKLPYGYFQSLAISQLIFDITIMTAAIYFNGGIETANVMLYVVPIAMSGMLLGRWFIYFTGLSASIIYDLLLILDYQGIVRSQGVLAPELHSNTNYIVQTLFFAPAMLLTITIIIDFVSKLIRETAAISAQLSLVTAQQAETEAIISTMGSALVATNRQGQITTANSTFERLTGWSKDEVIGQQLEKILPMVDDGGRLVRAEDRPIYKMLLSMDNSLPVAQQIGNYSYIRKDGSSFSFTAHLAPIILNKQVIGATNVFDDATTTKQIQQLKNNFVALASHQLKTPIAEIKGYIENMLYGIGGQISDNQIVYLKRMHEVTVRCIKLINNLLDISILEKGDTSLNIQPTDISRAVAKAADIYKARLAKKDLSLRIEDSVSAFRVMADEDKLVEIIGNVLSNAISYTRKGSITIRVFQSGHWGVIEIIDQGIGMDRATIDAIFEKDEALSGAPTAEGGTGLGLYLSKQLVLLQKGDIKVASSSTHGTTIYIKLPLAEGNHHTMDKDQPTSVKPKTILLVDDEMPFRQIYRDALKMDGYQIIEAEDGQEALEIIEKQRPDLVLLDLVLPKLSGYDVLVKLKQTPQYATVPVIVYSILNEKEEIEKAMKLGANDYTIKGVTPALEVRQKVNALLKPPTK